MGSLRVNLLDNVAASSRKTACWSGPDDPGRTDPGAKAPGSVRRRHLRVVAAHRSALPGRVLSARADAGRPAQVDRADGRRACGEVHYQALHHFVAAPGTGGRSAGAWPSGWWRRSSRRRGRWMTPAFPKTATIRWGCSASTRARWARRPTASSGCRSTPSPSRPAARWTGGCFCPSPGTTTMRERRAACHLPEQVHHRPKWQLVLDMLDELDQLGPCARRCWSPTPATARSAEFRQGLDDRQIAYVVQVKADTSAYPEQVAPDHGARTGTGPPPTAALPRQALLAQAARPGRRPGGGVELIWPGGSKGLQHAPASWPCGSARPGSPHAVRPRRGPTAPGGSCRCAGCWPNGRRQARAGQVLAVEPARRHRRWWSWSASASCAGGSSRTTANSRARSAWTTSKAALRRLAPPRDPGLGRPRLPHPGAAAPPETGGVGLTLWQLCASCRSCLAVGPAPARSASAPCPARPRPHPSAHPPNTRRLWLGRPAFYQLSIRFYRPTLPALLLGCIWPR